jgi:glyoxylase I family protein
MLELTDLDHIVVRVSNLALMLEFYRDVLGCHLERELVDLGMVQLRAGRSLIDLVEVAGTLGIKGGAAPGAEGRNVDHFCLGVRNFDSTKVREYLGALGYFTAPAEPRYGARGLGQSLYVQDPEGNTVELRAGD